MLRGIVFVLATSALAGCAAQSMAPVAPSAPVVAAPVEAPAVPKPQYGTYGFDTAGMDRSVAPGDNFYQFANGTWAKNTAIPADKSNYGMFSVLEDLSRERTRQIIEEQAKDPNSRIGNAFASFMDRRQSTEKTWRHSIRGSVRSAPSSPRTSCRRSTRQPINSASASPMGCTSDRTARRPTNTR